MKTAGREPIHINQLLHGYDEGHRLLAGSIKPAGQSAKTLLTLSDLSGRGFDLSTNGYMTGYPLPEMNAYALSRTWLATEMPRPGCVWTHTLLIDFSDLAMIDGFTICELFQRPLNGKFLSYNEILVAQPRNSPTQLPPSYLAPVGMLIDGLYGSPLDSIFVRAQSNFQFDEVVLALWLQQWPRLRRNFRFCTWVTSDRSRRGERFDLQFVAQKKYFAESAHTKNKAHWIDIDSSSLNKMNRWVEACAMDALFDNRESDFRKFIWRYGAEVDAGRAAYKPLALIWQALQDQPIADLETAVAVIKKFTPPIASLTQAVTQAVALSLGETGSLSGAIIEFLVQNIGLIEQQIIETHGEKIAAAIWQSSPEYVRPFFRNESTAARLIAMSVAKFMSPADALTVAAGDVDLFCSILTANMNLSTSRLVWEAPDPIPRLAAGIIKAYGEPSREVFSAMIDAENINMPEIAIEFFGQAAVTAAVEAYDASSGIKQQNAWRWMAKAKEQPNLLLVSVGKGMVRQIETLACISSFVSYRAEPVLRDVDEWARAISEMGNGARSGTLEFYTFLMARALSGTSPEPAKLINFSFDVIHNALIHSQMDSGTWRILQRELPNVSWWQDWDKAHRLRIGVVKLFVDSNISPKDFLEVTNDDDVFGKMVTLARWSHAGFSYLESVLLWANKSTDQKVNSRSKIIEKTIKWFL